MTSKTIRLIEESELRERYTQAVLAGLIVGAFVGASLVSRLHLAKGGGR